MKFWDWNYWLIAKKTNHYDQRFVCTMEGNYVRVIKGYYLRISL